VCAYLANNKQDLANNKQYLENNKQYLEKLDDNFMSMIEFANLRLIGEFEKAGQMYKSNECLKKYKYIVPDNLYERAAEFYNSADIAITKNGDVFQAVLKLAVIRENMTFYILEKLIKKAYREEIIITAADKPARFNGENLEKYAKDLKEYIIERHKNGRSVNKEFDFGNEINSYGADFILKFLIEEKNPDNKNLKKILTLLNSLEDLKKTRNNMAHTINPPKYNEIWLQRIKKILILTAGEFQEKEPAFDFYKELNNDLTVILQKALNNA